MLWKNRSSRVKLLGRGTIEIAPLDFNEAERHCHEEVMEARLFTWLSAIAMITLLIKGGAPTAIAESASLATSTLFPDALILRASFNGIDGIPEFPSPDATIAAGPTSIVIARNHWIKIRGKSGTLIDSKNTYGFVQSVIPAGEGVTDPIVVFDPRSNRFFFVQSGVGGNPDCTPGTRLSHYLLAVSKSSSPQTLEPDDWYFYALDRTLDQYTATTNWGDYDHLSMNDDVVVITSSMFSFEDNSSQGPKIRIIEKSRLINGEPITTWTDFVGLRDPAQGNLISSGVLPAIQFDDSETFFLVSSTGTCGYLI